MLTGSTRSATRSSTAAITTTMVVDPWRLLLFENDDRLFPEFRRPRPVLEAPPGSIIRCGRRLDPLDDLPEQARGLKG